MITMISRLNNKYILNNDYRLCDDINRVLLVSSQTADKNINLFVHPVHAVMLGVFNGESTLDENIGLLSEIFSISKEQILKVVLPFIENKEDLTIVYDKTTFYFPQKVLIKAKDGEIRNDISVKKYLIRPPFDFNSTRAKLPKRILFVINLTCATECFYCYANKNHKYIPLSTARICDIIEEAKNIDIVSFELSGGEVLIHPDWDIILKKFMDCGFNPYISTKVPVTEDTIRKLKEIGINDIQISIDTLDENLLIDTLNVKRTYAERIRKTITTFDEYGFQIVLKSTLTKKTCNRENVSKLLEFASHLENIKRYTCSSVGYSHYKGLKEFKESIPTVTSVKEVEDLLQEKSGNYSFEILDDLTAPLKSSMNNYKSFKKRGFCSGNLTSMTVLPDGKVTICEELYWNENFILGDLREHSIREVWNSERAKSLYSIKQDNFPTESPCRQCKDFEKCRHERGVCWKDIIAVYGDNNWLYPDPRCPHAPKLINDVFYNSL